MNLLHDAELALPEQLAAVDLNLLVAFDALSRERNVTRAAERVGVTQSAMSHALRRLRELFGDELLVRGQGGMVLTARAEALAVPVRGGLVSIGRALAGSSAFDPETAKRTFRIASPDLFDVLVMPPLLAQTRQRAPNVDIALSADTDRDLAARLETGELDVAIAPRLQPPHDEARGLDAPSLMRASLGRDGFVCLLRRDHAVLSGRRRGRKALSLECYAALSHAMVSPSGHGPGLVDRLLELRGLKRRIALRIPNFYAAVAIVAQSDLVLTAPRVLSSVAAGMNVVSVPPPLALPDHGVELIWHARFSTDPGHRWLRELVTEVARAAIQSRH